MRNIINENIKNSINLTANNQIQEMTIKVYKGLRQDTLTAQLNDKLR